MARPKNTPEKIERMRNSMMDAVISLLDEVSPEKVSIRMIAEKVGVSHMVFYTYFKDREEIMKVLVEREKKRINDHFASKLEKAATISSKKAVEELLREYAETAEEHPKIFRLFWMDPSDKQNGKRNRFNHLEESFQSLAKMLKIGMDRGEFARRDERLAASIVMSTINGPIIMNQCDKLPKDISCEVLLEEVVKEIFKYLES